MRIKVLHVYSGNLFGGIESLLVTFARSGGLVPGLEQSFALCFEGRLAEELVRAGTPPVLISRELRMRKPWTILHARSRLRAALAQERFDAMICHTAWVHALLGPVARASRVPLVHYLHNPIERAGLAERWAALTPPDLVLAVSRDTQATASSLFPESPSEHFYCPMPRPLSAYEAGDRDALRAELGARPGQAVILQASRMDRWKGHEFHLRALAEIQDRGDWICWIAGGTQRPEETAYLQELENLARQLGIAERVRFLGHRSDVPRLMGAADLLCQANTGPEGFSVAFLEAACAGLPIVTADIGGGREIVGHGKSGFLIPVRDVAAISSALRKLIADPGLRRRMGEESRRRAIALCDPKTQMERFSEILSRQAPRS